MLAINQHTKSLDVHRCNVPYGSLRQRHPRGTRLPLPTVVHYVKQITAGLQYAHNEKLIHRDIKPENFLLGADNEALLADFGIALIAQTHYHNTQEVVGTLAYMAPEQLRGRPRQASDQYSLGIVVYEWLSGSCPFQGSFMAIASQHVYSPPPALHMKIPSIPPDVEHAVMTALAKDPQQRFASVEAFARALEQACTSGPPVLVAQPSNPLMLSSHPDLQTERVASPEHSPPQSPKALAQEPSTSPVQERRRGLSASITLLLSILALLIIGGSGLLYYTRVVLPIQVHPRATMPATVSSTTGLYVMATSGSPSLDDQLNHNNANNWVEYTAPQGGGCAFRGGAYYSRVLQKEIIPCLAQGTDPSDFAYQVQMTIITGDEGGLIFRSDAIDPNNFPFSTNYYLFSVSQDGHYSLSYQGTSQVQLTSGSSPAIKTGLNQPNLLTVIARGGNISLYVNKQYIASVTDSRRGSGLIGVFAQNDGNLTDVAFSNVQVWNL